MPGHVAIVHGWSDSSSSFRDLRDFLVGHDYDVHQIWLGDYVSTDDDVRVEDVAKRMNVVVETMMDDGQLPSSFDLIVHSTGALVAREWMWRLHAAGKPIPVKRFLMLAPANFGSRLAGLGKSMIGRITKGWNNWFQTGTQMLNALELASEYQWDLARRDLLDADGEGTGPYGAGKVWPFTIVGTSGYTSFLRGIANEDGADGTVRAAAANLNAIGMTVDFAANPLNPEQPEVRIWHRRSGLAFPFRVLADRNHTTIHEPQDPSDAAPEVSDQLGKAILEALGCETDQSYQEINDAWLLRNEEVAGLADPTLALKPVFPKNAPGRETFNQHFQFVAFVRDDHGRPVDDYFLEFFGPDEPGTHETVIFQREVLADVHVNSLAKSRRCLYVDRTDLFRRYYQSISDPSKRAVAFSISAAAIGPNVRYFDKQREGAKASLVVHTENEDARAQLGGERLRRNTTHLVEIIIPRQPIDRVFRFSPP